MADYERPPGFRFQFGGVNLKDVPDAIAPNKYSAAQNVRGYAAQGVRARPGYVPLFACGNNAITDIRAYAALGTDDAPRWLARDNTNAIFLDTGIDVVTLAGSNGSGVSFVPFRPGASPQAWMYVAGDSDYQKISAPANNNVTAYAVGLPEPQSQVDAAPLTFDYTAFTGNNANWTAGGTATSPTAANRSTDTITNVLSDSANSSRKSCAVGAGVQYQVGELTSQGVIQDVLPPIPVGLTIQSIFYWNSSGTGACTIVPNQLPVGIEVAGAVSSGFLRRGAIVKIASEFCIVLSVTVGANGLICFDTSTTGSYSAGASITGYPAIVIDSGTAAAITAAQINTTVKSGVGTLTRTLASSPFGAVLASPSATAIYPQEDDYVHISILISNPTQILELKVIFNVDASDTTFTQNIYYYSIGPSVLAPVATGSSTQLQAIQASSTQSAIIQSLSSTISNLEAQLSGGVASQARASIQAQISTLQAQLAQAQAGTIPGTGLPIGTPGSTAAGSSQWTEVMFPISALTRIGNDQTRTLVNCTGVQVYCNVASVNAVWMASTYYALGYLVVDPSNHIQKVTSAGTSGTTQPAWNDAGGTTSDGGVTWTDQGANANSVSLAISSLWVGGGGQPDTGVGGAPYRYRLVPRSSLTGVIGNPGPDCRYGVMPRRQPVIVKSSALSAVNAQQDIWDVYRYGGTVTSFRRIGSVSVGSDFTDTYFDDSALAGALMETDNYEPWPSVSTPFVSVISAVTVIGTWVILSTTSAAAPLIGAWLPGTLVTVNGLQTYTLRSRPLNFGINAIKMEFIECAGSIPGTGQLTVQEPIVARQFQQSVWGPDAQGVFFGVMDSLRPGTVSWSKGNMPDSVPAQNNIDLCPPSEPLLGGAVRAGVSLVSSTKRWWALYPDFQTPGAYNPIEVPVGRALITPWGHVTNGAMVAFWTRDGIATTDGGPHKSLTDEDLYPLFPHEGVGAPANIVRNGVTFYAPDYSRANSFRLGLANKFLYASYKDSTGTYRVLVCDLRTGAWESDAYADQITGVWGLEGQPGSLGSGNATLYPAEVLASADGKVFKSQDLTGDNNTAIACVLGTFEWDGGDARAAFDYGDGYLDCAPAGNVTVQPVSQGNAVGNATVIAAATGRAYAPISVGGITNQEFLGLQFNWTETYPSGNKTTLHVWQLSVIPRPEQIRDRYGDWKGSLRG